MGVSKVVLVDPNTQTPEVLMDVTGDDTSASVLLAGNVGTRNDGEKVTGNIPAKTSSDLTASGATVTAPAGYYSEAASKSVGSGTAGTPVASKGTVSNHSVSVTPYVTNSAGYIASGNKFGTAVTVSASELVSGTKTISENGTGIDVTNYAAVDVAVPSSGGSPVEGLTNALEFRSASSFTLKSYNSGKYWDGTLEWTDGSRAWAVWDGLTTLTASGGVLYLRGTNNTYLTGGPSWSNDKRFVLTGTNISCSGNIETLLDYSVVAQGKHPIMGAHCFSGLFYQGRALISAPALPATTLSEGCYSSMFNRTSITSPPALPATTLTYQCYAYLFYDTPLTSVPALPATTLAERCYQDMFESCTAITSLPVIPATTIGTWACSMMFYGCTGIKLSQTYDATEYPYTFRIPQSGTGAMAQYGLNNMFGSTGGSFTGTPSINTDYYTENPLVEATA